MCVSLFIFVWMQTLVRMCLYLCECVPGTVTELNLTPELKVQKKALQKKPVPCLQAQFVRF